MTNPVRPSSLNSVSSGSPADVDDCDNGDPRAAYLSFVQRLSPAAREALLAPPQPVEPPEPSEIQLLREDLARLEARLFPPERPASSPVALPGLANAVEAAGLIGVERQVVDAVARTGQVPISTLALQLQCDVLSAVKRAKPKLKKVGWNLSRRDNHIEAKPLPRNRK